MAGAAKGHYDMLFLGLIITMPLILFGSALLMKLMERFPIFVTIGAALLGYVAGEMVVGDIAVKNYIEVHAHFLDYFAPIACAVLVVVAGSLISRRHYAAQAAQSEAAAGGPTAEAS
jgi:predicted tellurium resistance membrane protein TerC